MCGENPAPSAQNRVASMQIDAMLNVFYSFQPEIPFYYLLFYIFISWKRSPGPGVKPQDYNHEQL